MDVDEFGRTSLGKFNEWRHITYKTTKVTFAFRIRNIDMGNGEYATSLNLLEIWNGLHKHDHHG